MRKKTTRGLEKNKRTSALIKAFQISGVNIYEKKSMKITSKLAQMNLMSKLLDRKEISQKKKKKEREASTFICVPCMQ